MAKRFLVDWLKIEHEIREQLREYRDGDINPDIVLKAIDDILGEGTGRGWEFPEKRV